MLSILQRASRAIYIISEQTKCLDRAAPVSRQPEARPSKDQMRGPATRGRQTKGPGKGTGTRPTLEQTGGPHGDVGHKPQTHSANSQANFPHAVLQENANSQNLHTLKGLLHGTQSIRITRTLPQSYSWPAKDRFLGKLHHADRLQAHRRESSKTVAAFQSGHNRIGT